MIRESVEFIARILLIPQFYNLRIADIMSEKWATCWNRSGRFLAVLSWLPLVPLVIVCVAAFRTADQEQHQAFQSSVAEQRTRLIRVATQIEMAMESTELSSEWQSLKDDPRVRAKWFPSLGENDRQLYAAIVDPAGRIIVHSDPQTDGQPMGIAWYDQVVAESGYGVVKVKDGPLAQGLSSYDVRVPILHNDKVIGELHSGLSADKLDLLLNRVYWVKLRSFIVPAFASLGIAILAYYALRQLANANESCHRVAITQIAENARVLEQIAGGLAHEIRNPLHAIRLNLHVLSKWYSRSSAQLSPEDLASTLTGSSAEVDRIEQIIRDLLRYAIPEHGQRVPLNLVTELQATANLMREDLKQKDTELVLPESLPATWVNVDSSTLRQMLIELFTFAQNNAGPNGRIDVVVAQGDTHCELDITDSGSTLSEDRRAHLFEPFQATPQTGSGFGLAVVKTYVEWVGGTIQCVDHSPHGNSIRMRLPRHALLYSQGAS